MKKVYSLLCGLLIACMLTGLFVTVAPMTISEAKSTEKTEGLTVSLKGGSVKEGKTKKLTLKVKKDGADKWIKGKNLTKEYGKITWTSSDSSIATISSKGYVKGIKQGSVTITAETENGLKATCTIKVKGAYKSKVDKNGLTKITLSGNKEDHVITDSYSYIEGDKFFILLDKDVDIPGDFSNNISLIIDTLEKKVGYTFMGCDDLSSFDNTTVSFGFNPWEGLKFGKKVPIFILVDREDATYVSNACELYAEIYNYELFSLDLWNSVPSYRDNAWRRRDFVDYFTIAHELTHTLTNRYSQVSRAMTEGSANYFGMETLKELAQYDEEMARNIETTYLDDEVGVEVTSKNAEEIFLDDFKTLDTANRGAEYAYGRYICEYLAETYGDSFMHDYLKAVKDSGFKGSYGYYTDKERQKLTDVFKKVFGKKVFQKFGKWFEKNYK